MLCPDLFFPFPSPLPCLSFTSFFPFSSFHSHLSFLFSSLSSPLFLASFLPPTFHPPPALILSLSFFPFFFLFHASALWRYLCFRPVLRANALTAVSAAGFCSALRSCLTSNYTLLGEKGWRWRPSCAWPAVWWADQAGPPCLNH